MRGRIVASLALDVIRTDVRYASQNGTWLCRSPLDNLIGSFRQQRTGSADPLRSFDFPLVTTALQ